VERNETPEVGAAAGIKKMTGDPKTEHMAKRQAQGLSYRKVAGEFGVSKSTAHRKLASQKPMAAPVEKIKPEEIKQGFQKLGSAK
jgi:transposase